MAKQWYVVHTYSGHEQRVKQAIEHFVMMQHLEEKVSRVVVPSENIMEIKDGKRRRRKRVLMPGYLLIEMEAEDELFASLKQHISGLTGFVSSGSQPIPLSEKELHEVLEVGEQKEVDKPRAMIKYRKGQQVKIAQGPFADFIGVIDEIDEAKCRLRIMVTIFGRQTPVELDVFQVESI